MGCAKTKSTGWGAAAQLSHVFSRISTISGLGSKWRKSSGLAEPRWHTSGAGGSRSPPGAPAARLEPGRARPISRLPRDLAPSYVCDWACRSAIDGRQAPA